MYTLHILCTRKGCLLLVTMDSQVQRRSSECTLLHIMCTRKGCLLSATQNRTYEKLLYSSKCTLCTFCVPKKCAFFQRQCIRSAESTISTRVFVLHILVYLKVCLLSKGDPNNYKTTLMLLHIRLVPKMYTYFPTIDIRMLT